MLLVPLSGCSGVQSALAPAGEEAAAIYQLLLVMVLGGALVWFPVVCLLLHAARRREAPWTEEQAGRLILFGGVAFPVAVLLALLTYAVWLMPVIRPWFARQAPAPDMIEVTGEQFWWRIRYPAADGTPAFETANELRLPVGKRVAFSLKAADVIHSFWIPVLGGKMDMIPGRTNTSSLLPTRTGVCALCRILRHLSRVDGLFGHRHGACRLRSLAARTGHCYNGRRKRRQAAQARR
jgi:cytochrome c oxidase subunit 2